MPPFFLSRSKSRLHRTETFDSASTMSTASLSSGNSRPASRNYDTGFPDWFAAHTTSLRHPDAITTPGACISAEDLDPSRALRRSKHSLLAKHKRTLSHGKIAPERNQGQRQHPAAAKTDHAGDIQETHEEVGDCKDSTSDASEVINWEPESPVDSSPRHEDEYDTKSRRVSSNLFKRWRNNSS